MYGCEQHTHLQRCTTRRKCPTQLPWSWRGTWHRPCAEMAIAQAAARTPIDREHGAQRRYQTHTHRPSSPPWPIQTVQRAYPSVRTATCSEVEEAVSQHDHRRDEGRLMIRGGRSMVRERMHGDVWSRVARVDRWVDLLCFRDVMSLIGCVGVRVGGALSGRR